MGLRSAGRGPPARADSARRGWTGSVISGSRRTSLAGGKVLRLPEITDPAGAHGVGRVLPGAVEAAEAAAAALPEAGRHGRRTTQARQSRAW
ncbi:hypothetical protein AB0H43_09830 [Hamadaea sp. NPDC050747]|uniref:hypothetical protein n=1 Tax=Hamadaea sp. NPDC050747 TaxID=3155789 RepID=UPI0033F67B14